MTRTWFSRSCVQGQIPVTNVIQPAQLSIRHSPRAFSALTFDISARLCGPPAIDREFKTIDFLTIIDLRRIPDRVRVRFF